jgi:DsbC/DsbD-like thiol-disulfide interchange protein
LTLTSRSGKYFLNFLFSFSCFCFAYSLSANAVEPTKVSLISDRSSLQNDQTFNLGILFEIEKGWHLYWRNPGDSGLGPKIVWEKNAFLDVSEFRWPTPKKISNPPFASYGYEDELLLPMGASFSNNASKIDKVTLKGKVTWLVCKADICLSKKRDLSLEIPVTAKGSEDKGSAKKIQSWYRKMPVRIAESAVKVVKEMDAYSFTISKINLPKTFLASKVIEFYPNLEGWVDDTKAQAFKNDRDSITLKVPIDTDRNLKPKQISGLFVGNDVGIEFKDILVP